MAGKFTLQILNEVDSDSSVVYTKAVIAGETLHQSMKRMQDDNMLGFSFEDETTAFGEFIISLNGLMINPASHYQWMIYIKDMNNQAKVGVSRLIPKDGEAYIFVYKFNTQDHANLLKKK